MIKKLLGVLVLAASLSACAPMVSQSGLYWGTYSNTLYAFKKNPSPATRSAHIASIQAVIAKSKELKLRVPPGLYAELGMYMIEDGKKAEANRLMSLELATYPESKPLVDQILKKKHASNKSSARTQS